MWSLLRLFGGRKILRQSAAERPVFTESDRFYMQRAIELARQAESVNEVPVGAVLVRNGEIIGEGYNRPIGRCDPSAHAEILALRNAGQKLGNYRLIDTTLYVTLEPCAMCAMAMVHARVARVVYGAHDFKTGACGSVFSLINSPHHNHRIHVEGGLMAENCAQLLSSFFKRRRAEKKRLRKILKENCNE
jgi:tRNA(adenine34) deaminase